MIALFFGDHVSKNGSPYFRSSPFILELRWKSSQFFKIGSQILLESIDFLLLKTFKIRVLFLDRNILLFRAHIIHRLRSHNHFERRDSQDDEDNECRKSEKSEQDNQQHMGNNTA